MTRNTVIKFANVGLAVAVLTLLFCVRSAAADPADVQTLHISGTGVCDPAFPCVPMSTASVSGNFQFDFDSEALVGPWSFTTSFGTLSSATGSAFFQEGESIDPSDNGFDIFLFRSGLTNSTSSIILEFIFPDPGDVTGLVGVIPGNFGSLICGNSFQDCFDMSTATVTAATPEPSSLLLLGSGLLGLGPFIRRRFWNL